MKNVQFIRCLVVLLLLIGAGLGVSACSTTAAHSPQSYCQANPDDCHNNQDIFIQGGQQD